MPFCENIGSAYQQWLSHPAVYQIACIPKAAVKSQTPNALQNGISFKGHPKWDVMLFAVANEAGLDSFVNSQALKSGLRQMMIDMRVTFAFQTPAPRAALVEARSTNTLHFYAPWGFDENSPPSDEIPRLSYGQASTPLDWYNTQKSLNWQAD